MQAVKRACVQCKQLCWLVQLQLYTAHACYCTAIKTPPFLQLVVTQVLVSSVVVSVSGSSLTQYIGRPDFLANRF